MSPCLYVVTRGGKMEGMVTASTIFLAIKLVSFSPSLEIEMVLTSDLVFWILSHISYRCTCVHRYVLLYVLPMHWSYQTSLNIVYIEYCCLFFHLLHAFLWCSCCHQVVLHLFVHLVFPGWWFHAQLSCALLILHHRSLFQEEMDYLSLFDKTNNKHVFIVPVHVNVYTFKPALMTNAHIKFHWYQH